VSSTIADLKPERQAVLVWAFRAEVAGEVRPAEFNDEGGLIRGLSTGIQAALAKLAGREERPAGPVAARRVLRLAPRPVFLAGREDLLAGLETWLAGEDGPSPRAVALFGLGGAGKTSVALEYAHRHLAEVGVAWQFPAGDPAVLAASFGQLAAQLGAAERDFRRRGSRHLKSRSRSPSRCSPVRSSRRRAAGPRRSIPTSSNSTKPPGRPLRRVGRARPVRRGNPRGLQTTALATVLLPRMLVRSCERGISHELVCRPAAHPGRLRLGLRGATPPERIH
jgi:hypothetical protein